jgi:hypothetical protein
VHPFESKSEEPTPISYFEVTIHKTAGSKR